MQSHFLTLIETRKKNLIIINSLIIFVNIYSKFNIATNVFKNVFNIKYLSKYFRTIHL